MTTTTTTLTLQLSPLKSSGMSQICPSKAQKLHDLGPRKIVTKDRETQKALNPWEAPSVQRLANKLGSGSVQPVMVEGPGGTILAAVGDSADHDLAVNVLSKVQEDRARARELTLWPIVPNKPHFAAVYEHRDASGRPQVVGRTNAVPEQRFVDDYRAHQGVKNMVMKQNGSSEVVWAGVGSHPLGPQDMEVITNEIVSRRSRQLNVQKLQGPKPYSRHGY